MSKYQPYPEYKESGLEWLNKVPQNWDITRLRNLGHFTASGIDKKIIKDEPLVKIINFVDVFNSASKLLCNKEYMVVSAPPEKIRSHLVKKGDLIFTPSSETIDEIGVAALVDDNLDNTAYSYHVLRLHFNIEVNHSYKKYITNNGFVLSQFSIAARGTTRQTLGRNDFKSIAIVLPPFVEQTAIASFLDHETAKIDTLIAKQQRMIELLREKRSAMISHAVTKGFTSNVQMKDSGVEWLGEVPEHWHSMQIRRILTIMEQGKSPECDNRVAEFNEWGVLKTSCVNNGIYNSEANKALPSTVQPFPKYEVKEGDILMSRASGSVNLIGSIAYVHKTRARILMSDKIFRLYLDSRVNKIFFIYLMSSSYIRANIERAISGGEGMANNITKGAINSFIFALPPLSEQVSIADYLDTKTAKIDTLIAKARQAIELMKERRTALISAVVTGKIDVRKTNIK